MSVEVFTKEQQARGNFNNGEILEYKPIGFTQDGGDLKPCLLYTSPSPRDRQKSRMPSSA